MREGIEDRIIAYFDGRLTDSDSAELLHRVSVSPEIRKLFREHEMLRELARSAQASAVVRPELEASLFSRIEALAAAEQAGVMPPVEDERRKAIPIFWTRWRIGLATAVAAFVLGTAITLGPELFKSSETTTKNPDTNTAEASAITPNDATTGNESFAEAAKPATKQNFNEIIRGNRDYEARQAANERPALVGNRTDKSYTTYGSYRSQENVPANESTITEDQSRSNAASSSDIADVAPISSVDTKRSTPLDLGGEKGNLPVFRAEDIEQDEAHFEASLETSSGFSYPASGPRVQPFADPRVSLGYFLDRHNLIGVRFTSGLFQALPEQQITSSAAYTSISRNLEQERKNNYGVYYTHRIFGVLSDLINLDASIGAGYITGGGYTISTELGLRLPLTALSSKLFFVPSFSLTRVHISAPSMNEITNGVSVSDGPVLIEGSDVQNTINGRIHYGISYQL